MWACINEHEDVVKLLLDHSKRIELNAKHHGLTALMIASQRRHQGVVQLLLDHYDIDLNVRDNYGWAAGWAAFMWACNKGHKYIVQLFLGHSDRIDLNARGIAGMTAFMTACSNGQKDVVKLLLDHLKELI